MTTEPLEYRRLQEGEADKLVALVRECYGESYPVSLFYDATALTQKLREGLLISAVAINDSGDLVGHVGTLWEYAGAPTADAMTGMIRAQYQRRGILAELTARIGFFYPSALTGLQLYSVTTHTASQRNGLSRGTAECGFLVPEFPSSMNAAGVINDPLGDRNPVLAMYCPVQAPPVRELYVPGCYRELLCTIHERLGYTRRYHGSDDLPLADLTQVNVLPDPRKGVNRMVVSVIGADWESVTQGFRQSVSSDRTCGWYMDIPLSHAGAIALITRLREEGWYFGCLLPERQQGDVLRMQYSQASIHRDALQIASEFGWQLVDFVLADRKATNA